MSNFITSAESEFGVVPAEDPQFNYSRPPLPIKDSIKGKRYLELLETTSTGYLGNVAKPQQIVKYRLNDITSLTNWHRAWFRFQGKIQNYNTLTGAFTDPAARVPGAWADPLTQAQRFAFKSFLQDMTCMWRRMILTINSVVVESHHDYHDQQTFLLNLLEDTPEYIRTLGSFYELDYYGGWTYCDRTDFSHDNVKGLPIRHNYGAIQPVNTNDYFNPNFVLRAFRQANQARLEFYIPMRKLFNFWRDKRSDIYTRNMVVEIEAEFTSRQNIVKCAEVNDGITAEVESWFSFVDTGLTILVPIATPNTLLTREIESQLEGNGINQKYTYIDAQTFRYDVPIGSTSLHINVNNQISKPVAMFSWFTPRSIIDTCNANQFLRVGSHDTSPSGGIQNCLIDFQFIVNSQALPFERYKLSNGAPGAANKLENKRAYLEFLDAQGYLAPRRSGDYSYPLMSYEDFASNYFVLTCNPLESTAIDNIYRGGNSIDVKASYPAAFSNWWANTGLYLYVTILFRKMCDFRMEQYSSSVIVS